jgi:hypothetical protein
LEMAIRLGQLEVASFPAFCGGTRDVEASFGHGLLEL